MSTISTSKKNEVENFYGRTFHRGECTFTPRARPPLTYTCVGASHPPSARPLAVAAPPPPPARTLAPALPSLPPSLPLPIAAPSLSLSAAAPSDPPPPSSPHRHSCARPRHRLPILDPISPLLPSRRRGHTGPCGQIHHCRLSPSGGDTTWHPMPPSPVHIGHGDHRRPPCNPSAPFPGQAPPVRHSQTSLHCHTAPPSPSLSSPLGATGEAGRVDAGPVLARPPLRPCSSTSPRDNLPIPSLLWSFPFFRSNPV
jgi:hypothetical protein